MARHKSAKTIAKSIETSFRQNRRLLLDSMEGLEPSSTAYLQRVMALAELERKYRDERARRGLDSVNLGVATTPQYNFRAVITSNGGIQVDEVTDEKSAARLLWEQELNEQYACDTPNPTPLSAKDQRRIEQWNDEFGFQELNEESRRDEEPVLDQLEKELQLPKRKTGKKVRR